MPASENSMIERLKRYNEELKADKPFQRKVARFYLIGAILLSPIYIWMIFDTSDDDAKQAVQVQSAKQQAAAQAQSDRVLAEAAKAKEDSDREKQQFEDDESAKQAQAAADASAATLAADGSIPYDQAPHTKLVNPVGCNSPEIIAQYYNETTPGFTGDMEAKLKRGTQILNSGHCIMALFNELHVKCFYKFDSAYGIQNTALGKFLYQSDVYYAWVMASDITKAKQGSPTPPMCPSDIMEQPLNYVPGGGLPR